MKKPQVKELARERVDILIKNALLEKDKELAEKQARLAKKMAMRFRLRLPYEIRQLYCKECKQFMVPGRGSRVRVGGGARTRAVRITCLNCGHTYRRVLPKGRNKDL